MDELMASTGKFHFSIGFLLDLVEEKQTDHQHGHRYKRKIESFLPPDVFEQVSYQSGSQCSAYGGEKYK